MKPEAHTPELSWNDSDEPACASSSTQFSRCDTSARQVPPRQLLGEEIVSVADVILALRAPGVGPAMPRGAVGPKAAGGHWWGDEGNQHGRGLGPLRDQLSQRIRWVHARLAFFQSL